MKTLFYVHSYIFKKFMGYIQMTGVKLFLCHFVWCFSKLVALQQKLTF